MFTGIIEEIGTISAMIRQGKSLRLSVYAKKVLSDLKLGDSVSINGICFTAVEIGRNHFSVDAVEETLRRTSLFKIKMGDQVNLERALQLSGRLGGHMLTGHIDGVAEVKGKVLREESSELILAIPKGLQKYIVPKGSLGIEGVSLTVARVTPEGAQVALIPHTLQNSTLGKIMIGDKVNLEVDILSKYLEGLLGSEAGEQSERVMMDAGFMPLGIWEN